MRVFSGGKLIDGRSTTDIDNYSWIKGDLPQGNYVVYVKNTWLANDVKDYSVRTYMPVSVTITKATFASEQAA